MSAIRPLNEKEKVRTPSGRLFRFFCQDMMPTVVWILAIVVFCFIWFTRSFRVDALGVVEQREVLIMPAVDGVIQTMEVEVFDQVQKGQVLARLDASIPEAAVATAQAEIKHLQGEYEAAKAEIQFNYETEIQTLNREIFSENRRLETNVEAARVDLHDRVATQAEDKIRLMEIRVRLRNEEGLVKKGVGIQEEYDVLRLQADALEAKIRENEVAIKAANESLSGSLRRREEQMAADVFKAPETLLAGLLEAVEVQKKLVEELQAQLTLYVLRAPISGIVTDSDFSAGAGVVKGTEMMTIAAPESQYVVAYVEQRALSDKVRIGTKAELRSRRGGSVIVPVEGTVVQIGLVVQAFPLRLFPDPNMPRWGQAVKITLPANEPTVFLPGETLDVRFHD